MPLAGEGKIKLAQCMLPQLAQASCAMVAYSPPFPREDAATARNALGESGWFLVRLPCPMDVGDDEALMEEMIYCLIVPAGRQPLPVHTCRPESTMCAQRQPDIKVAGVGMRRVEVRGRDVVNLDRISSRMSAGTRWLAAGVAPIRRRPGDVIERV